MEENGKVLCVIEVERFLNIKNAGYAQYLVSHTRPFLLKEIVKWIEKKYGISEYENCYYLNTDTIEGPKKVHYEQLIPAKNCTTDPTQLVVSTKQIILRPSLSHMTGVVMTDSSMSITLLTETTSMRLQDSELIWDFLICHLGITLKTLN